MNFKDHFSKQAADYAIFRPGYPTRAIRLSREQCAESPARMGLRYEKWTSGSRIGIGVRSRDGD
jgi:hypothetical protein